MFLFPAEPLCPAEPYLALSDFEKAADLEMSDY